MKNQNAHFNKIIKGGLVLTASSFIAKLLSAVYKVPFQNLTGDAGFYVYQQVYPLYGLAVAFSLTGLPAFISKIISEVKDQAMLQKRLREINTLLVATSLLIFLFLQLGASSVASLMGDVQLEPVIKVASLFFLLLPFLALIRGYFQGHSNMLPTSMSQVIEQLVRVLILLGVALYFTNSSWSVYEMGASAYHSAWLGALAGSIILLGYLLKEGQFKNFVSVLKPSWSLSMGRRLMSEGALLIATSSIMIMFQFIDSFTVFKGLTESGYNNEMAIGLKGIYDRGQPLVQLGLVVGLGFATTSMPILRKWFLERRLLEWSKSAASLTKITLLFSGAATVGLMAVMPWMNYALFTDYEGTATLQVYVISVFLASMIYCLHTILQSTDVADNSLFSLMVGLAFKVIMNQLAVRSMGIIGSSIVTVFSLVLIFVLMLQKIKLEVWRQVLQNQFLFKMVLLLSGLYLIVTGAIIGIEGLFSISGRAGNLLLTLLGVAVGALFFIIGMVVTNILDAEELKQLPLPKIMQLKNRK